MTWHRLRPHLWTRTVGPWRLTVVWRGARWSWHVEASGECGDPRQAMRAADATVGAMTRDVYDETPPGPFRLNAGDVAVRFPISWMAFQWLWPLPTGADLLLTRPADEDELATGAPFDEKRERYLKPGEELKDHGRHAENLVGAIFLGVTFSDPASPLWQLPPRKPQLSAVPEEK